MPRILHYLQIVRLRKTMTGGTILKTLNPQTPIRSKFQDERFLAQGVSQANRNKTLATNNMKKEGRLQDLHPSSAFHGDISIFGHRHDHLTSTFQNPAAQGNERQLQPRPVPMLLDQQGHHAQVACHGEDANGGRGLLADVDLAVGDVVYQGEGLVGRDSKSA